MAEIKTYNPKPYVLTKEKNSRVVLNAAYCKYYPHAPYVALFESYPAAVTKVMLLRKVADDADSYGFRLCKLCRKDLDGSQKDIGLYVSICTVNSEKEATEAMERHIHSSWNTKHLLEEAK